MSLSFDPYHKWLGIPAEEQPPHHYRLLGISPFESDPDVIEAAADRQMAHVQRYKTGQHSARSQSLLNELSAAKLCLLVPEKRTLYDQQLKSALAAKSLPVPAAPEVAALSRATPVAAPVRLPQPAPQRRIIEAAGAERQAKGWPRGRNRRPLLLAGGAATVGLIVVVALIAGSGQTPQNAGPAAPLAQPLAAPTEDDAPQTAAPPVPRFAPVPSQSVKEEEVLTVRLGPQPPSSAAEAVQYALAPGAPRGMRLDRQTGELTWQPQEDQGPQEHRVPVRMLEASTGRQWDETTVVVTVEEVNRPPVLELTAAPSVNESGLVSLQLIARDADLPANRLAYSFDSPAPPGATLNAQSGQLSWTPQPNDAGKEAVLKFRVTDNGPGKLSATHSVTIQTKPASKPAVTIPDPLAALAASSLPAGDPRQDRLVAEAFLAANLGTVYLKAGAQSQLLSAGQKIADGEVQLLRVTFQRSVTDETLSYFRGLKHLGSIEFFNDAARAVTDAGLEPLGTLENLQNLAIYDSGVSGPGLRHLHRLTRLSTLRMSAGRISDESLAHLAGITSLKGLYIGCNNLTDESFRHVGALTNLIELDLGSQGFTGAGLSHLKNLAQLKKLHFSGSGKSIPDANLVHLAGLSGLKELQVAGNFSDEVFTQIANLPNLEQLQVYSQSVTGSGISSLENCEKLVDLTIGFGLTDAGLSGLTKLKSLKTLTINAGQVTGAGLAQANPVSVEKLTVMNSKVFDEANLPHLEKWPALRHVEVIGVPPMTDAALAHLANIDRLAFIELGNADGVTNAGLAHLKTHPNLRFVALRRAKITDEGIAGFKQAMPECRIEK